MYIVSPPKCDNIDCFLHFWIAVFVQFGSLSFEWNSLRMGIVSISAEWRSVASIHIFSCLSFKTISLKGRSVHPEKSEYRRHLLAMNAENKNTNNCFTISVVACIIITFNVISTPLLQIRVGSFLLFFRLWDFYTDSISLMVFS